MKHSPLSYFFNWARPLAPCGLLLCAVFFAHTLHAQEEYAQEDGLVAEGEIPLITEEELLRGQLDTPAPTTKQDATKQRNDPNAEPSSSSEAEVEQEEGNDAEPGKGESVFEQGGNIVISQQAMLQGSNKVTAKTSRFKISTKEPVRFGNLYIKLFDCWKTTPQNRPESVALLEISEQRAGEGMVSVFRGWMFASSPALSALEHPVYDITLTECIN